VLDVRIVSMYRGALWLGLPNAEGANLYALWRLRTGHPLYEPLTQPPFSFTPYNFFFYYAYAAAMDLFRVPGPAMTFAARIVTIGCAAIGCGIHTMTAVRVSRSLDGSADRASILLVGFIAWVGCGIVGWSALSIRPDMLAATCTIGGIGAALAAVRTTHSEQKHSLIAGLLFGLAWSAKHSYVMSLAGVAAYFLWRRRIRAFAGVTLPAALIVVCALSFGSSAYRFAILEAQALNSIRIHEAQFWLRAGLLTNLLMWAVPVWSVATGAGIRRGDRTIAEPFALLAAVALCVGAWTLVSIGKLGASEHYLIEPNVIGALWTSVVLSRLRVDERAARAGYRIALVSSAVMLVFVIAVLAHLDVLRATIGLRARGDRLTAGVPGELARRQQIADRMNALPPPIFFDDDEETLSQPWFSNRSRYPAAVIEHVVFDAAEKKGLLGPGLPGLFEQRYFGTVFVSPQSELAREVANAGYRREGTIAAPVVGVLEIYTR
jgi:hypothetical protein